MKTQGSPDDSASGDQALVTSVLLYRLVHGLPLHVDD